MRVSVAAMWRGVVMAAGLLWCTPQVAQAELYQYETPDGDIVISTERRSGMRLIEVISDSGRAVQHGGDKQNGRAAARQAKKEQNLARAYAAREDYLARNGHKVQVPAHGERFHAFDDIILEACGAYDVPVSFVKAVIKVESNFNPLVISPVGAQGLMQLMPNTAAALNVTDPFDPRQNIFGGTKLLRILIDRYDGDINLILAAYNAGERNVAKYNGIPFPQTRDYVASVYRWYKQFSARSGEQQANK